MRRAVLVGMCLLAATAAGAETFRVTLSGGSEVVNPGDADGSGVAFVAVDGTTVHYYLWAKGIVTPTAAHIHSGRATENGAVVINLAPVFANPSAERWVAVGSVTADAAVAAAIAANPGAHYVNIHNDPFPGGAIRGQLLGSGVAPAAAAATLSGTREVGEAGDADGRGFAGLVFDGEVIFYYVAFAGIAAPTSAHVHRGRAGENGPVMIGFTVGPVAADGVIEGAIITSAALVGEILADPAAFYLNIHNADFPGGAVRGQLGRTETALHFPVAARNKGAGTSLFKTDVRVMSFTDEDATVWAEWYPKNTAGLAGPAATTEVSVAKGGEAVLDDAPGTLFGANDRGAIRLVSLTPFLAVGNTYNDQRGAGLGTFGQFAEALPLDRAARSGALLLGSNRPKADLVDFRTNLGYFNPNPVPVQVTFRVVKPDGTPVGAPTTKTFPPYANDLLLYYQVITGVPAAERNQPNFLVTYSANAPVFIFSSVVDNKTDDGLHQPALPAPPAAATPSPNQAPSGAILSPAGDVTIAPGESVTFEGEASDPDGDEVHVVWSFGDGATSTELSPGPHTYANAGTFTVTLAVTDSQDLSDPTPATRTITVAAANQPPDGTIVLPAGNATTREGGAISFAGAASDPDGDDVTVLWDFGDGATSSALDPGEHIYAAVGVYTVTFTATDGHALADPTPATLTVTVGENAAPDGTIVAPAADVTVSVGQPVAFEGTFSDSDDTLFSVQWSFGDGVSSGALVTSHTYLTAGAYTVALTVTDALGKADPTPAIRIVTVIEAVTLTQLQSEVFSDNCSGCHPPNGGGMDLRAGQTFASIVNVNSSQQPSLKRVKPGDPDNSYLIRKLNGGPGISGDRMPQGGPFLTPSELQRIRDWILAGAQNN